MQRFDIREPQEVAARGRYLRWDTDSGQPINVRAAGVDLGPLYPGELMELPDPVDKWLITPQAGETGFVRVGFDRIDSDRKNPQSRVPLLLMLAGSGQVAAGAGPGWVSGSPVGIAPSGTVAAIFDLGPEWRQYRAAALSVAAGAGGGGITVGIYWEDTAALTYARTGAAPGYGGSPGIQHAISAAAGGGPIAHNNGVMGRYLTLALTNQSASLATAAGSSIAVAVYPS